MSNNNVLIALNPNRPRAAEIVKVTIVIRHPMDHGIRGDIRVAQSYPDYIYELDVLLGDTLINRFKLEGSVSSDPILGFNIVAPSASTELSVRYKDLAGAKVEVSLPFDIAEA